MKDFTTALIMDKDLMNSASALNYDMNSKELIFSELEAPTVICEFDRHVIGTDEQLFQYYCKELRRMFPRCLIEIKPINGREYILVQ